MITIWYNTPLDCLIIILRHFPLKEMLMLQSSMFAYVSAALIARSLPPLVQTPEFLEEADRAWLQSAPSCCRVDTVFWWSLNNWIIDYPFSSGVGRNELTLLFLVGGLLTDVGGGLSSFYWLIQPVVVQIIPIETFHLLLKLSFMGCCTLGSRYIL